eukprot:3164806-Pleurochrysis_carterae.AAC.1
MPKSTREREHVCNVHRPRLICACKDARQRDLDENHEYSTSHDIRLCRGRTRLAVRSPHALHKVMPHRHLGVCVVPQDWHTRLVTSGTRFVLRSEVIARGIAPLKVASAAAVSACKSTGESQISGSNNLHACMN